MRIYLICTVRRRTPEQEETLTNYVAHLEGEEAHTVYFPGRDTGVAEETTNVTAIAALNQHHMSIADEVHVFYDPRSSGSIFDLGMAWAMGKPIVLVNPEALAAYTAQGDAWARLLLERVRARERRWTFQRGPRDRESIHRVQP